MIGSGHPDDARLIVRHYEPWPLDEALERHVSACAQCAARERAIAAALDPRHGTQRVDGPALTDAWLDTQRRRIQARLAAADRPSGRVIAFPRDAARPGSFRSARPMRSRLAAVAAILALVSAAGAGWVIETQRHGGLRLRAEHRGRVAAARQQSSRGQDAFLSDIDMALASPQTPALRALDALTAGAAEAPTGR